ncbi:helix-turn-helix domain-containing protein [Puia dinghuensis]|uniref:HTH araC/xylS-type domain-containing protein n=1 Tax=Puia dinghuensis TaxID=1792502 RepID=A0A8J2UBF9_9BACT|nr:hypothetical protein GCM10011511_15900 [Puia dinghuensis]
MKLSEHDLACLELAKSIITKNPDDHITIDYLSRKVGLNKKKLKYGFKRQNGMPIHDFQVTLRMNKAVELLKHTTAPIKEIAFKTGYKTISSFSFAFRKKYQKPPSQCRSNDESNHLVPNGTEKVPIR